ncbi:MAG: hypothetical protein ACR2L2_10320 [Acidobacteriota bacterium]
MTLGLGLSAQSAPQRAQAPAQAGAPQTPPAQAPPPADDGVQAYRSNGKRDPFRSLVVVKQAVTSNDVLVPPAAKFRPAGLPGMLVSEVTVIGGAGSKDSRLIVIQGRDKINYLARVGDKLYNGFLAEIDSDDKGYFVVFMEELRYPDGKVTRKRTVRRLYAEQSGG